MKRIVLAGLLVAVFATTDLKAQHVSVRLNFPVGFQTRSAARAPFGGAVWVGPEWQWRGGRYVSVPGYWGRPVRQGAIWVPGYWKYSRWGYKWVPGHWR